MKCSICSKETNGLKGLSIHLIKKHSFEESDLKNYYDNYLKKDNEGSCYFCGKPSIYFNFTKGYHRICDSKDCLGKTRATGTYEFLMYKYNLNQYDAIKLMNERAVERGEKIKNGLWKSYDENENFFKEKSRQCVEFWIKRGLNEEDSLKKSRDIQKEIVEKTIIKRHDKNNKHLYLDVNPTQKAYWMKKGFDEKEAIKMVSERQKTFTLEKCIEKRGEIEGIKVWEERQKK